MAMPWRSPGVLRREPPGVHTAVMTTGPGQVVLDTNVFVAARFNPGSHSAPLATSDAVLRNAGGQMAVPVLKPSEFARRCGALHRESGLRKQVDDLAG